MPRPDHKFNVPQFGPALRREREAAGLTQQALADRLGVTQGAIGNLEAGRTDPRLGVAAAIAKALKVPLAKLLD